ncbi:hypothetical protein BaRGS_00037570 [Batillaria attramentaria]|uniref:Uncharacterized protein n=1 Tax=Batillaria attramentaria TaxID=370345 RepID=A0ABD0J893_9CAEN
MAAAAGDAEAQTSLAASSEPPRRPSGGKHVHVASGTRLDERTEVLEVTEKHGTLYNAIPCMPLPVAILCCIFNIVVPGLGEWLISQR